MSSPPPLIVISPHLDDGVFSCGNLIAARPGAVVATVFAAVPAASLPAPDWDRRTGFDTAAGAMRARRDEDQQALRLLAATPLWLEFFDSQYGVAAEVEQIALRLQRILAESAADSVIAPLGLFHGDHLLTHQAALSLWRRAPAPGSWLFYEDAPYRRFPGLLQERLAQLRDAGIHAAPVDLHRSDMAAAKAEAVCAYRSQLPGLGHGRQDLQAPERYWQLQWSEPR
ncbi:MAG: PIG-L family deacetylase [Burkholderiaceae bacterium]